MAHEALDQTAARAPSGIPDRNEYTKTIDDVTLPPTVRRFASRYDRVRGERDAFLWKWIYNLFDEFTLSSVPSGMRREVYETKTLLTIFVTVLDDLAEASDERATFDVARHIPFEETAKRTERSDVKDDVIEFLEDLWVEISAAIEVTPRFDEFADVFEYDLRQTCNAMEYSRLLNHNMSIANRTEAERYDAYNMTVFPYACIDLMDSPAFDRGEFGALRSLLCELQQMARIGNWITTWERELAEGDVSSGVVVCALRRGVISTEEVTDPDGRQVEELVERIKSRGIEAEFIREWEIRNGTVRKRTSEIKSVDCGDYVDGIRTVMNHHLASEGSK